MDELPPHQYDISELAKLAKVSPRTIRYYGELGLLPANKRAPGQRRFFTHDSLERLRFISRLKNLGLTLTEISELNTRFAAGATPAMLQQLNEMLNVRISQLQQLLTELQSYQARIINKLNS